MTFTIDLGGRTALVTGGGQGVGRATCLALASAGASVVVNDFVPDRAQAVADEVVAAGGTASPLAFDVSSYTAVKEAIASTSGIDILVNNAGMAGPGGWSPNGDAAATADAFSGRTKPTSVSVGPFVETEPEDWERYFAVNLYGVMYCTRAALPHMIERNHGRVITIISEAARVGEQRMAPYAAAKAGAAGFTRAIAREVGRNGITVNNIALATIDTIGLAAMAEESDEIAERVKKQLGSYIIRRLGEPDDVAGLITYLSSPLAEWITAQTYAVNGGYTVNQ